MFVIDFILCYCYDGCWKLFDGATIVVLLVCVIYLYFIYFILCCFIYGFYFILLNMFKLGGFIKVFFFLFFVLMMFINMVNEGWDCGRSGSDAETRSGEGVLVVFLLVVNCGCVFLFCVVFRLNCVVKLYVEVLVIFSVKDGFFFRDVCASSVRVSNKFRYARKVGLSDF